LSSPGYGLHIGQVPIKLAGLSHAAFVRCS
jgi:hypothetical protein